MGSAAAKNNTAVIQFIFDHREGPLNPRGTDLLNQGNEFGWTPLFCALATHPNVEAVALLLKLGADKTIPTRKWCGDTQYGDTDRGTTPLQKCLQQISQTTGPTQTKYEQIRELLQ